MGEREEPATDADLSPIPFTPEEQAEVELWQQLGHVAWAMIDEWEKEDEPTEVRGGWHGD